MLAGIRDVAQVAIGIGHIQGDHIARGQNHSIHVHRKKRGWDDRRIAGPNEAQQHVRKTLFGPQADNRLRLRIQTNSVLAKILAGKLPSEIEDPIGLGVTVIAHIRGGFGEFLDDQRVWRVAGIAHP